MFYLWMGTGAFSARVAYQLCRGRDLVLSLLEPWVGKKVKLELDWKPYGWMLRYVSALGLGRWWLWGHFLLLLSFLLAALWLISESNINESLYCVD